MSGDEARKVAEELLRTTDLRGYETEFASSRQSTFQPDEWDVVFDLVGPGGTRVAGGIVVVVDGKAGTARVSDDP